MGWGQEEGRIQDLTLEAEFEVHLPSLIGCEKSWPFPLLGFPLLCQIPEINQLKKRKKFILAEEVAGVSAQWGGLAASGLVPRHHIVTWLGQMETWCECLSGSEY